MKKFKHKKTGEIATYKDGILKSSGFCVEIGIEPSNEFWQEVIEKEYEILSFKIPGNDHWFATLEKNGMYGGWSEKHALSELNRGNWSIQSVKRLSDGEVFTVGDKITGTRSADENPKFYGYTIIKKFYLEKDKLVMDISTGTVYDYRKIEFNDQSVGDWAFLTIKKYIPKQPLFTTEDGVDIFEGDYCSHVNIADLTKRTRTSYNTGNSYSPKSTKYFSTEEKAEEYIIMNNPCLSINDIKNIIDGKGFIGTEWFKIRIKELVKQKIEL